MRKIRLKVDELEVESFSTAGKSGKPAGTVHGQQEVYTSPQMCPSVETGHDGCYGCPVSGNLSCTGCPRDSWSCVASCGATNGMAICLYPC